MPQTEAVFLHRASHLTLPAAEPHAELLAGASRVAGRELWRGADGTASTGLWSATAGVWRLDLGRDLFAFVTAGRAVFDAARGDALAVTAGDLLHLKNGWRGTVEADAGLRCSYARCAGVASGAGGVLARAADAAPLSDWGMVPVALAGCSRTSGILLQRDPDGAAESGIWTCTPGSWRCEVTRDEVCHFLRGRCTYTHDSGARICIEPDTLALFPRGWRGVCEVHQTVRKVYLIV